MYAVADFLLEIQLADDDGYGNHDFRLGIEAFLKEFGSSLEDGAELGLADFGIGDAETYSAVAHHGVDLVQAFSAFLDIVDGHTFTASLM